jgi:Helicase associated domain
MAMSYCSFAALLTYDLEHGNMDVSRALETSLADGSRVKLHKWLSKQVAAYKDKKLKPDRLARLQELVNVGKLSWDMATDGGMWQSPSSTHPHSHPRMVPLSHSQNMRLHLSRPPPQQGNTGPLSDANQMPTLDREGGVDMSLREAISRRYLDEASDSESEIEELDEEQVDALMHVAAANS